MAVNQGAIQLQIIINNKSLSVSKKHLVSLNVKRVIGDSANEFTLEVFDETAYQVENLLIGSAFPSITVKYSASTTLNKSVIFTGMCLDYNTAFTGRAMMLSITGILMNTGDVYDGWWFDKATIEWCGSEPEDRYYTDPSTGKTIHEWWIDGKNAATFANYKDNRDVCAIVVTDENGNPTAYFNPGRIFQRIIHKYNGDKLGSTYSGYMKGSYDATSTGQVKVSNVTDFTWNYFINKGFTQECAAAIMGNIEQESSFKPDCLQNRTHGPAAGLFQWENYDTKSKRWKTLYNYASNRGKSWTDVETQLDFAMSELEGYLRTYTGPNGAHGIYENGTPWGWPKEKLSLAQYKAYKDVNEATEIFSRVFERPRIPLMNQRKKYANNYLAQYKNKRSAQDIKQGGVYTTTKEAVVRIQPLINSSELGKIPVGKTVTALGDSLNNWVWISYIQDGGSELKGYILGACLTQDSLTSISYITDAATGNDGKELAGWGTGGTGNYKIAECDETRWIANLNTIQSNETAAQYITRVLCKSAVSDTGKDYVDETAGFKYWCDAKGHHFKALDYNKNSVSKINVSYGLRNSQIISFSISNLGAVAMVWGDKNKRDSVAVSSAAMSDLYNDTITAGGENILNANVSQEIIDSNKSVLNWYQDTLPAIQVKTSTTESDLSATLSNLYNELSEYAISAELTIWGEYSKGYTPGDYLDIVVMTAGGHRHYSSGVYMITSMEDNISGAGYTQTMRLLKLNKTSNNATTNQAISNPSLTVDESGNIIATYTKVTHIDEHTRAYELFDINGNPIGGNSSSSVGGGRWRPVVFINNILGGIKCLII